MGVILIIWNEVSHIRNDYCLLNKTGWGMLQELLMPDEQNDSLNGESDLKHLETKDEPPPDRPTI